MGRTGPRHSRMGRTEGEGRHPRPHYRALQDENPRIRQAVAKVLGKLGPDAKQAVPALMAALKDTTKTERQSIAEALGKLKVKEAIPALIAALKDSDPWVRGSAASALGAIGPDARAAVPDLIDALKDDTEIMRIPAAFALNPIEASGKDAIRALGAAFKDPVSMVRDASALTLLSIAERAIAHKDLTAVRDLTTALKSVQTAELGSLWNEGHTARTERAMIALEAIEQARWVDRLLELVVKNKWMIGASILVLLYLAWFALLWLVILRWWPLRVLHWNDALKPTSTDKEAKLPHWLGELPLSWVRYVFLIGFFHYHRRVLDAWVAQHVETCRENYGALRTVQDRAVHVTIPVRYNGNSLDGLTAQALRPEFANAGTPCRLLIHGEGGAGKTSLACQLGRWALAHDAAKRLAPHLMVPVLLEEELDDTTVAAGSQRVIEAARGKLQALSGAAEPIARELFEQLLRRQRVLVIVDHFSEMTEATRSQIRPQNADFPVAALIVTSRRDEPLGNIPRSTLCPIRIEGNRLSMFMDGYLNQRGKCSLFDDEEYFDACRRLSRLVGGRTITVLLAKLYADQWIAAKEGALDDRLPETIPDLMLRYVTELHAAGTPPDVIRTAQHDARIVAWECLKGNFRSGPAARDAVLKALVAPDANKRLAHLENVLHLVQTTGADWSQVRFVLDPLAEYLAGLEVVEDYKGNRQKWERFLKKVDEMPGAPQAIEGFLLAVRECGLASDAHVPDFVVKELGARCGLAPAFDPQTAHQDRGLT